MLTIKSLGLQEQSRLLAAVALMFALDVLEVYEKEYPTDSIPHSALEFCAEILLNQHTESAIMRSWLSYDLNEICSKKIHTASKEALASIRTILNAFYITTYDSIFNLRELEDLVNTAATAKQAIAEKYIHYKLFSILPLVLEYKIENQESFGEMEIIWEYLNQEQQDLAIFNLDILTNKEWKKSDF